MLKLSNVFGSSFLLGYVYILRNQEGGEEEEGLKMLGHDYAGGDKGLSSWWHNHKEIFETMKQCL